ncbi:MAG: tRNA uridine-5-carboxymethylaminomethyl(34) synthesis GTPase MnmE [Arenicella sp.]
MDSIFALATARGKSGVAIIRVSGDDAFDIGKQLAGVLPAPRSSALRYLRRSDGTVLDQALGLVFERAHSFTGEDVVEFHVHGSTAVASAVLAELETISGCRLAEPGEFTRRALENEQLDLAQVEGLADLIDADTEAQRVQALRVLSGGIGEKARAWRQDLTRALALLEATIDFVDDAVPVDVSPEVMALLNEVQKSVSREFEGSFVAERIRNGFEVAIVGPPNAGKSTLLNAIAGRAAAITSSVAGTTRDVIEVNMDLAGLPVTLLDTAGVRETADEVERLGVDLAKSRADAADLRVFLLSREGEAPVFAPEKDDIVVVGKGDLQAGSQRVSGKTGLGVSELLAQVTENLESRAQVAGVVMRERHRLALGHAVQGLENARIELEHGSSRTELCAEELRVALRALDMLVGRVDVENVLDEIFASFCLGK